MAAHSHAFVLVISEFVSEVCRDHGCPWWPRHSPLEQQGIQELVLGSHTSAVGLCSLGHIGLGVSVPISHGQVRLSSQVAGQGPAARRLVPLGVSGAPNPPLLQDLPTQAERQAHQLRCLEG